MHSVLLIEDTESMVMHNVDALKIDRSFVRDIGAGAEADEGVIAPAIVSLGHALNLKVIAEGVETDARLLLKARRKASG